MKYIILNNGGIKLTGSEEAPTSRTDSYFVRYLGNKKHRKHGLLILDGCYKAKPKCFYSCEGRGMTEEASVMEVEEQPQV